MVRIYTLTCAPWSGQQLPDFIEGNAPYRNFWIREWLAGRINRRPRHCHWGGTAPYFPRQVERPLNNLVSCWRMKCSRSSEANN